MSDGGQLRGTITVDVVSDVVCPWCYIGQKRLDMALERLPDLDVLVRWRPFQLDPTIPPGGLDRRDYMVKKFGSEARVRQIHASIMPVGAAEGIHFDFDAIRIAPNTLDAHRVIRWAADAGSGVQDRLVRRLFRGFFEEGRNVGDVSVLAEASEDAGMDGTIVKALLATDRDQELVADEAAMASRRGITGVPCFLLDGRYAMMGAQEPDALTDAIRRVADPKVVEQLREVS